MSIRAELRISGRVQGVWFRQSTKQTAGKLGVKGWVRNCTDGSVEAVLEGDQSAVQKAIDWCRCGPELAQVVELNIEWREASGEFEDFRVL